MPAIITGGVLEKDGKYLLIQEAKNDRGKWNLPAGHLDAGETIFDAAVREIKEESGLDVELSEVCHIGNGQKDRNSDPFITLIFTTKIIGGSIKYDPEEILDGKWFSYEEILSMRDQLRAENFILGAINNARNGLTVSTDIITIL